MTRNNQRLQLVGGAAVLIDGAVPQAHRQDVCDALLYAQLSANKHAGSRFSRFTEWRKAYRSALSALNWIETGAFHESKPAHEFASLVPAQVMQGWLGVHGAGVDEAIVLAVEHLRHSPLAQAHLHAFVHEQDADGARLVLELGIVRPGPRVDLCTLALRTVEPLTAAALDTVFEGRMLQGEVLLRGLSLSLSNALFEPKRAALRALMAKKQGERPFVLDLGPVSGAAHG